jgi:acyl-CoA thioester hydrolase
MTHRHPPGARADYRWFHGITTQWRDNDVLRHANNTVYLVWFDTTVCFWERTEGGFDAFDGPLHGVVADLACRYYSPVAWPDRIAAGLRVSRIGSSSVRYEVGVFREDETTASAEGHFLRVFVNPATGRPVPIPPATRERLSAILAQHL